MIVNIMAFHTTMKSEIYLQLYGESSIRGCPIELRLQEVPYTISYKDNQKIINFTENDLPKDFLDKSKHAQMLGHDISFEYKGKIDLTEDFSEDDGPTQLALIEAQSGDPFVRMPLLFQDDFKKLYVSLNNKNRADSLLKFFHFFYCCKVTSVVESPAQAHSHVNAEVCHHSWKRSLLITSIFRSPFQCCLLTTADAADPRLFLSFLPILGCLHP